MIIKSYAKINLGLQILDKQPNGYHNIFSVMHKIPLYDTIHLEVVTDGKQSVHLNCNIPEIPTDDSNIINKVCKKFQQQFNISDSLKIVLTKNIPIGAGLGGGSSNGAYILQYLNKIYKTDLSTCELNRFAIEIGSDLPFFLGSDCAIVTGIGQEIEFINPLPPCFIVIVQPKFSINTSMAYKWYDQKCNNKKSSNMSALIRGLENSNLNLIAKNLNNDFQKVISEKFSEIQILLDKLNQFGSLGSVMTGSGSVVYGIFDNINSAKMASKILSSKSTTKKIHEFSSTVCYINTITYFESI